MTVSADTGAGETTDEVIIAVINTSDSLKKCNTITHNINTFRDKKNFKLISILKKSDAYL